MDRHLNNKYENILGAIINNMASLKKAAITILGEAINTADEKERNTLVAFSNNLLFAFIDEAGKFYLTKDLYPEDFDKKLLCSSGFYSHDKKLKKLIGIVRNRQISRGGTPLSTDKQTLDFLRSFKNSTLYVDYDEKTKKVITPAESLTLKK